MRRLQQNPADELTSVQTKANPGVQDWNTVSASNDLEGNLTSDGNLTFAYDYENRLVTAAGPAMQVSSGYAADGGRVARSSNGEPRIHVLDHGVNLHPVLMEVGTNGVPVRYYIWAGVLAAHVDAGGDVRFCHADHQGSTLALTDASAAVTDQWFHDPYGETLNRTGATDTPYQWIGGYAVWNEGHSLYRMQARHYHAGLKRFTATDPLGVQGLVARNGLLNLYAYCGNNPLMYIDSEGLDRRSLAELLFATWLNLSAGRSAELPPDRIHLFSQPQTIEWVNNPDFWKKAAHPAAGGTAAVGWIKATLLAPITAVGGGILTAAGTGALAVGGAVGYGIGRIPVRNHEFTMGTRPNVHGWLAEKIHDSWLWPKNKPILLPPVEGIRKPY